MLLEAVSPYRMSLSSVAVPARLEMPPPGPLLALLPVRVQSVTVAAPAKRRMPPPEPPLACYRRGAVRHGRRAAAADDAPPWTAAVLPVRVQSVRVTVPPPLPPLKMPPPSPEALLPVRVQPVRTWCYRCHRRRC